MTAPAEAPELTPEQLAAIEQAEYDSRFTEIVYGYEVPRLYTPPIRDVDNDRSATLGFDVIDFATDVLGVSLLPWQRWWFRHALELNPDGSLRFSTILTLISRQNGKTFLLKILVLFFLYVRLVPLILGVAQAREIAKESMQGAHDLASDIADLADEFLPNNRGVDGLHSAVGGEEMRLRKLSTAAGDDVDAPVRKYKIAAASKRAGRSLSVHVLILDEFRHLMVDAWAALTKTTNAIPDSLTLAISNAGDDESTVMNELRKKILSGVERTAAIFEWSAPETTRCTCSPNDRLAARGWHKLDCELIDVKVWAQANPSLGYRITMATLRKDCALDPEEVFLTECLCVRVEHMETLVARADWDDCKGEVKLDPATDRIAAVLDIAPDSKHATLVAAAKRDDGKVYGAVVRAWDEKTIRNLDDDLPDLLLRLKPRRFGWFPGGPAAAKASLLRAVRRQNEITAVAEACQELVDDVRGKKVVQGDDPLLNAHVPGVQRLPMGDGYRFVRRGVGHCDGAYTLAGAVKLAKVLARRGAGVV